MKNDEEHLIERCKRNDQRACKELYDRYAPQMFGVCMRYSQSKEAAEEVLHDGFIKVFNGLERIKDAKKLGGWIRSVMIHTALRAAKEEKTLPHVEINEQSEGLILESEDILSRLDIHIILSAIQKLPSKYRSAINLCMIDGYNYGEAAKILGVEEVTVRTNIARARASLADMLKGYYDLRDK